jgi:hypothetical protein
MKSFYKIRYLNKMELNWERSEEAEKFSEFMSSSNENQENIILGVLLGLYITAIFLF